MAEGEQFHISAWRECGPDHLKAGRVLCEVRVGFVPLGRVGIVEIGPELTDIVLENDAPLIAAAPFAVWGTKFPVPEREFPCSAAQGIRV
jgi:hypothetical protein